MRSQRVMVPLIVALGAVAAHACVHSLAQSPVDPAVRSTNGAGEAIRVGTDGAGDGPGVPVVTKRATPTLLGAYPDWDYWNLDTSAVLDSAGLVHFAVRLWEYNNPIPGHDRYVVDAAGQVVATHMNWLGLGGVPAGTDGNGQNFFVRPSGATQHFGVVDSTNCIHAFNTSAQTTGWEVHYAKLDPQGDTLIDWAVITSGADCWNWYLQPVVTSDDRIIVTWIRDTQDICAIVSTDLGVSWSDIIVLVPNAGVDQAVAIKTVIGADDSLHFVWRTLNWATHAERLWYAKVWPDWTIAVDETVFHAGPAWYPYVSIDGQDSLHVTFAPLYDVATDMYYTRLRGDLDLGGAPASDALLTAIPERKFHSDPRKVHYPLNQVDARGTVHVVYEVGTYGRATDKDLYYIRLCALDGDLDCSETVDFADFEIFADVLAGHGNPAAAGCDLTDFTNADLDGDGDVDLADFALFQPLRIGGV